MNGTGAALVGRTAECGRLSRALGPSRNGTGSALVLRGPPGVGKSALLEWIVGRATDFTVLRATGALRRMSAPFSLLETLLPGGASSSDAQSGRERSALTEELGSSGLPVDRFKVAIVVFDLLAALAESKGVLVVIDDAQWADHSSLDALLLALRRLEDDAVTMLFAQRDGEPCALDRADLPTLEVGGLTLPAACELLEGTVAATVARQLAQRTAGNPLALMELAGGLDDMQRAGKAPLSPWLLRTPTVEAGFLHRIETLPADARRVLELASIDSAIEPAVLRTLAEPCEPDLIGQLTSLGFLRLTEHERTLEFTHPLLRTAVYGAMDPGARGQAHRRLASMLRRDDDVTRRAWHLAGASNGPDEAAAGELERAGNFSQARGAYAVAAETFERSADLTTDAEVRTVRLLAAGDSHWLAGDVERSGQVLDYALTLAPDQLRRADIQLKRIATQRGRSFSEMFDELTREAEATEAVDVDRAAMLHAQSVMSGLAAMRYEDARHSAVRALELLAPTHPMHFIAQLLHALVICQLGEYPAAKNVLRDFAELFEAVGPGPHVAGIAEYSAFAMLAGDDQVLAASILDGMIQYARRERALGLLPTPLSVRAELNWRLGSWAAALADATESLAIVRETEQHVERGHSLMVLGKCHGGVGRQRDARELLSEALAIADECDAGSLRYMASSTFGFVEHSAGDLEAARRHLLVCRDLSDRSGEQDATLWPWRAELVEVAHRLGDRTLATTVSASLDICAERHGSHQALAAAARSRAVVANDEATMRAAFDDSLAQLEVLPLVFERARTKLLYGEGLLQFGRDRDATEQLGCALDTFDELGAHPWSTRARAHLEPGHQTLNQMAIESLTDRELQVAVAVSTGKTSSEAASELFLSRRTVEHHLAAVYRKLGIRNRTQLAALVNREARPR